MAYPLSATKLQTYHRCARSYQFRYLQRLPGRPMFGGQALGTALHEAIARCYRDWDYLSPTLPLDWLVRCWRQVSEPLPPEQQSEGMEILEHFWHEAISPVVSRRPLGVEGRISGSLTVEGVEFRLGGRYDRLDCDEQGLHLVDFKTNRSFNPPPGQDLDLQLGLYAIALEQHYGQLLQSASLVHLRSAQVVTYLCGPVQIEQARQAIAALALQLRSDRQWQPCLGDHCRSCGYRRYCPEAGGQELPPVTPTVPPERIQLSLFDWGTA